MNTLKDVVTVGKLNRPPRVLLYGVEGIGKSTFGASALNPIIIQTESGLDEIDAPKFPLAASFDDVMNSLKLLGTESQGSKTVVIVSIDWREPLIWADTCARHAQPNIEAFGYAKGYKHAMDGWSRLLLALDRLRDEKGMAILLIGHAEIDRFDSPDTEPYDRYQLKLHDAATAKITEWCDVVGFVNYQVFTEKTDVGFNRKISRGKGGGDRMMYLEERPAYKAKNRYSLPWELPFLRGEAWNTLVTAIKASRVVTTTNETEGV